MNENNFKNIDQHLTQIVKIGQAITSDLLVSELKNLTGINYFKRDFLFEDGVWRGSEAKSCKTYPRKMRNVAVIGHSDFHTTELDQLYLKMLGFRYVFGANLNPIPNYSESIPLGLTNNSNESEYHSLFGDQSLFAIALERVNERTFNFKHEFYVNFTVSNLTKERTSAINAVKVLPLTKIVIPEMTQEGRISYLASLRSSTFVLCPRGNGLDTHRIWETLYMGGIPVVKKHRGINQLVRDLPVIMVDNWNQACDVNFMQNAWDKIYSRPMNLEILTISHWVNKIKKSVTD